MCKVFSYVGGHKQDDYYSSFELIKNVQFTNQTYLIIFSIPPFIGQIRETLGLSSNCLGNPKENFYVEDIVIVYNSEFGDWIWEMPYQSYQRKKHMSKWLQKKGYRQYLK